jgi:hypothetical protein
LVNVTFEVNGAAPAGPTALNVAASSGGAFTELLDENDNVLDLAGPVTNGVDPIDGVITIGGGGLPTVTLAVDPAEIDEASGVATFTATLSAAAETDVTVDLGLSGTATDGTDYAASGTQIVIAAGDLSGSVTVTATDDDVDEPDETVIAEITTVTGAIEALEQQATTTILDNDDPVLPTITLSVDNAEIAEAGGEATFTITLSEASTADVTVDLGYAGSATLAVDYAASGAQVVIPAGSTTGSVTVTAIDDDADEADETVVVDVTGVTGATGSGVATTTILDDDDPAPTVTLSVDNAALPEAAGVGTVTVTLSQILTQDVTIDLGYTGTATNGTDYTASAAQIVIAAGDTSGSVTVTAIQDTEVEANESIIIDITNVINASEAGEQQVTLTIADDEGLNEPPVLEDPGTQNFPETVRTLDVTLIATDPNLGDTLTYTAEVESAEYFLDQTLDLNLNVELFEDFGGLGEKWVLGGDGRTWYYIEPSGNFYQWLGGGVLNREFVASLQPTTHADPSLLYDAQPGNPAPVVATLVDNVLTLAPEPGFAGAFSVTATVSDGELTDSKFFFVAVQPNEAPTLTDPGPQTLPTTQDTLDVALEATDPMNDPLTFSASVETGEYYLDQTIGLQLGEGGLFPNWSGTEDERWVLSDDGNQWYFITPDGNFYRWLGGNRDIAANSELVATLSPATHADPALLYDAQAGAAVPATVSVTGSTLTIDPNAGFVGTFSVLVTVTDIGGATDSRLVRVDVTGATVAGGLLTLNLGGEGEGSTTTQADPQVGGSETSFTDEFNSLGMIDEGNDVQLTDTSDPLSAALDALLEEDLLDDDIAHNLAVDQQRSE